MNQAAEWTLLRMKTCVRTLFSFFFFLTPNRSFQITAPPTAQTPPFSKVTKNHHVPPVRNSALSCFYSASEWSMKLFKVPRKHQSQKHRTGDFQVVPSQDMSALPHLLQESCSSTLLPIFPSHLFSPSKLLDLGAARRCHPIPNRAWAG